MGVINATPDSFSDGGAYDPIAHALRLIKEGADIVDIGGKSTRPGAEPVGIAEELRRTIPVIEALARQGALISIDTQKPEVAQAAMAAGAHIWNDVSALQSPDALQTAARLGCGVILMHKKGDPQTMQSAPVYDDVVSEVEAYLLGHARAAESAGVKRAHIWIDPGIGFGKTLSHNLALINAIARLKSNGYPVLIGASNKSLIAHCETQAGLVSSSPHQRLGGTLALHLKAVALGADMVRVHDVAAHKQAFLLQSRLN